MPFLHPDTSELARLGGKAASLARLGKQGFEIPAWFVVPSDAAWTREELPPVIEKLGPGPFAVRSSASMEDGAGHSFAGQFHSYLDVSAADVPRKISDVRASAKSDSVVAYCREHGLPLPEKPAVLVQRMIAPRCAGVAFSADPVSGQRGVVVISAVPGTGEKLVSGEVDGENWRIGRDNQISSRPEEPALTEKEALAVADLARRCEAASAGPQDIEWAIDGAGKLWLL